MNFWKVLLSFFFFQKYICHVSEIQRDKRYEKKSEKKQQNKEKLTAKYLLKDTLP